MKRYNPMTIFPIFVLIVVVIGVLFTLESKKRYIDQSLAQVHINSYETKDIAPSQTAVKKLNNELADFQYPDSTILVEASNSAMLDSTDPIETITSWYKDKLIEKNYKSKTSIAANTNGNRENKFIAEMDKKQLYIQIKKPNGLSKTSINIELITMQ